MKKCHLMLNQNRFLTRVFVGLLLLAQAACGGIGGRNDSTASGGSTDSPVNSTRPATHFKPGFNLFSPAQDVELGRQSAQQIAQQVPLMNDQTTVNYVRQLGAKLARFAPGERFPYQFNVVGTREMNAFALPGGYIFINAGAITSARNEGELAGVMAHEIAHVALRHGTNQTSKAYIAKAGLGVLSGLAGVGGAPELGQIVNAVGGAGANMLFLKFGRSAERQADLEGARIMAAAGYDPRDMASFFQTLQQQGSGRAPEFLSDHPDPGNRVIAINEELKNLRVNANATRDTPEFQNVKARLTGHAAAANLTASSEARRTGPRDPNDMPAGARPPLPSSSMRDFQSPDNVYAIQIPGNWRAASRDNTNIIIAPEGGYGAREESVFVTHGLFVGTLNTPANDLAAATGALVQQQLAANPDFRVTRSSQQVSIGGRAGLATVVTGPSTVSGVRETDVVFTTSTPDGRLFYLVAIVPEDELQSYQNTFERIITSVRFR